MTRIGLNHTVAGGGEIGHVSEKASCLRVGRWAQQHESKSYQTRSLKGKATVHQPAVQIAMVDNVS